MAYSDDLEKAIKLKIKKIENGTLPVIGCGVNDMIAKLKKLDEPAAIDLNADYIAAIKKSKGN